MQRIRTFRKFSHSQVRGDEHGAGMSTKEAGVCFRWETKCKNVGSQVFNPDFNSITSSVSFTSYFPPLTYFTALQSGQREERERERAKNIYSPTEIPTVYIQPRASTCGQCSTPKNKHFKLSVKYGGWQGQTCCNGAKLLRAANTEMMQSQKHCNECKNITFYVTSLLCFVLQERLDDQE